MNSFRPEIKIEKKSFWLVMGFSFLIFFAQTKDFKLLFDGLTYVSISKNILSFNDWKILHYDPVYYKNFYQHPPLAMWLQALVFKLFGFSESASRLLSSFFSLLSVGVVFQFTKIFFGLPAAVWSSVALFTSTRYIKWSTNFYLDGILAFFVLLSACLWLFSVSARSKETKLVHLFSLFSGVSISLAFMTKGVVVFGAALIIPASFLVFANVSNLKKLFFYFFGLALPLLFWVFFADGSEFIEQYFKTSVSGRSNFKSLSIHPWRNVYSLWIPWWPLFSLTLLMLLKSFLKKQIGNQEKFLFVLVLIALSFPVGFSLGSVYLEHYLTPFYPVASIVSGFALVQIPYFSRVTENGLKKGCLFLFVITMLVATIAPSFHVVKDTAPVKWMRELESLPDSERLMIRQIAFTDFSYERWLGIATVQGKSDLMALGGYDPLKPSIDQTLLITLKDQKVDPSWKMVNCFYVDGFKAYTSEKTSLCERQ